MIGWAVAAKDQCPGGFDAEFPDLPGTRELAKRPERSAGGAGCLSEPAGEAVLEPTRS